MTDRQSPDYTLLALYLADECTATERAGVDAWRDADPANARLLLSLDAAWRGVQPVPLPPLDVATRKRELLDRIGVTRDGDLRANNHARLRRPEVARGGMWRHVAVTAVGCVAAAATVVAVLRQTQHISPPTARTFATAAGHQATVTLVDGSHVTLGPATTIAVTGKANTAIDVSVSGEAVFTVAHRTGRPFTVRAGNAVARVLGTTFTVRHYTTDAVARVVVADGRVAVASSKNTATGHERILDASMLGVVTDSGVLVTPRIAVDDYSSVASGRLVFRATPATEIIAELNRAYDVDIRLADTTLADRKLTATIPVAHWSADAAIEFFAAMLDATYSKTGRIITVTPSRSHPRARNRTFPLLTPELHYGK